MVLRIVLAPLLLALSFVPVFAQKRVALVIGIDSYDNLRADAQLRKAKSDAAAIALVLRELAFEVITADDVTRSAFNGHWQDFLNKLSPGDTAALFFAGHGVELGGRNYLLPRDVPNLRPGREELLRRESLSLQEFLADLRERGTGLNLVILDACRDNPFEQLAGRSLGRSRGLALTEPPEGTFIMFSAGTGESALDRLDDADRNPNSVYTRTLLPLLRSPGLSLTDIAEQVRTDVRRVAATVQHRQTPAYYNQVLGRICLIGEACGPRGIGNLGASPLSEAERAWDRTKDTASIATLEAFIRRYADTYYGDIAKLKLAELRAVEAAAKRKADDETKAAAEQKRLAALKIEEEKQRANAEAKRKVLDEHVRLKAAAEEEAKRKATLSQSLHRELKRVGCDPGLTGSGWKKESQSALQRFASITKQVLNTDEPTQEALDIVASHKTLVCSPETATAPARSERSRRDLPIAKEPQPPKNKCREESYLACMARSPITSAACNDGVRRIICP